MRKFFQKFKRDCKGAVTVLVTLLLIPAILVSGTGVDLARVYAAKSIVQDANQMGANAALASYDALLKDLYGLFAIMSNDPEFADMADAYIKSTIFGNDPDKSLGTFQLFYGSNLQCGDVTPAAGQNLKNPEVLRRQIEEYSKFRAPVIIMEELVEKLKAFSQVKADSEIIKEKMDIEDDLDDLEKIYKQIYEKIQSIELCKNAENTVFLEINRYIDDIQYQFEEMYDTRDSYEAVIDDDEQSADYLEKYNEHIKNIKALVNGGTVREGYQIGGLDESGEYHNGYWIGSEDVKGLVPRIEGLKTALEAYQRDLDELITLCKKADKKKETLKTKLDALETKLNSGDCSDAMKEGVKPTLEEYRKLIGYNLTSMAQAMKNQDGSQIASTLSLLDEIGYGDPSTGNSDVTRFISLPTLGSLSPNGSYYIGVRLNNARDYLYEITSITPKKYDVPGTFKLFKECGTENAAFYSVLESMYQSNGDATAKKESITKNLEKAMGQIQHYFNGLLEFEPEGAWNYENGSDTSDSDNQTNFGSDGDWGASGQGKEEVKKALDSNLVTRLGDALDDAANKILLLTYDAEMFSCYSTNKHSEETGEVSMSGIPFGLDVNYYYQSELEYLYNGNLKDAKANLKTVTGMIFLVRFVMDYTVSFTVSDVTNTVNAVKSALAFLGPFAFGLGELTRVVMALGEAVMDTSRLKNGDHVAFLKNSDTWRFSISGITGTLQTLSFPGENSNQNDDDNAGLNYKDYMRLFLLLVEGDTLAQRTANLIELNVTNKQENIGSNADRNARQSAMANAEKVDLSNAITGFSLTTTVDLNMLFLSMPFAQKGVNGVVPPGTLEISATDYRGY